MKRFSLLISLLSIALLSLAQLPLPDNPYKGFFDQAYKEYRSVPRGLLEAVAFTNTHFRNLDSTIAPSCTGMPRMYGVMGLVENGKNYFRENLRLIAQLSGYSAEKIKNDPRIDILAYAKAFSVLAKKEGIKSISPAGYKDILIKLSELPYPTKDPTNDLAMNSFLYSVFTFLMSPTYARKYNFHAYKIDLEKVFGEKLKILSAKKVFISDTGIYDQQNDKYSDTTGLGTCPDYNSDNCIWDPTNNFSNRDTTISAVVIHVMQGSYSAAISWFKNPQSHVSVHYLVRSRDGQVTQMVREKDEAWHVRSANPYTIGIEHEGYVEDSTWFTKVMYQSSADIVRHICKKYNINPRRTFYRDTLDDGTVLDYGLHELAGGNWCTRIAGHQHFPRQAHVDPGPYWHWNYYYRLVNLGDGDTVSFFQPTGQFTDSGGDTANYSNDERKIYFIKPRGAYRIRLVFKQFQLEKDYDFMFIYDGDSVFAPKIGRFNTHSPDTIYSSGKALTVEFRSDCHNTEPGWIATWQAITHDIFPPQTSVCVEGKKWKTKDFLVSFKDKDDTKIKYRFYQVSEKNNTNWFANTNNGFLFDNFDSEKANDWHSISGTWQRENGYLIQTNDTEKNANIYVYVNQSNAQQYLYEFRAKDISNTSTSGFGLKIMCDTFADSDCNNGLLIWFDRADSALTFALIKDKNRINEKTIKNIPCNLTVFNNYKVILDKSTGDIYAYVNDKLIGQYQYTSDIDQGHYMGLCTQQSKCTIDFAKIYVSRTDSALITVGTQKSKDITTQSPSPTQPCAQITSIVTDTAMNISAESSKSLYVDLTPPQQVQVLDGLYAKDLDTIYCFGLYGHWTRSRDVNSGIARYLCSAGTTPGDTNILAWTDNQVDTVLSLASVFLLPKQKIYINVQAQDSAGLKSPVSTSDGLIFIKRFRSQIRSRYNARDIKAIPNPFVHTINIYSKDEIQSIKAYNTQGKEISILLTGHGKSARITFPTHVPSGLYLLRITTQPHNIYKIKVVKE